MCKHLANFFKCSWNHSNYSNSCFVYNNTCSFLASQSQPSIANIQLCSYQFKAIILKNIKLATYMLQLKLFKVLIFTTVYLYSKSGVLMASMKLCTLYVCMYYDIKKHFSVSSQERHNMLSVLLYLQEAKSCLLYL